MEVLPGQRDSSLSVRLLTSRLLDKCRYEALSYAWGDVKQTESLQVVTDKPDVEQDSTTASNALLAVTHNCASAIRRLRLTTGSRMLWIDSICINQSCVDERNHQLRLMPRIYGGAWRVAVYLGESDESARSDAVMDWLSDLHEPSDDEHPKVAPSEAEIWALLGRRWFNRVWVLQEVHLAKKVAVICGDREVSWDAFEQLLHWNNNRRQSEVLPFAVHSIRALRSTKLNELTYPARLLRTLRGTRELGATEPRDKLYAIVPLIELQDHQHRDEDSGGPPLDLDDAAFAVPKGDYSWSTAKTFTNLARDLINAIGPAVLSSVETPTNVPGLPSWAPDWSTVGPRAFRSRWKYGRRGSSDFFGDYDKPTRDWSFSDYTTSEGSQSIQLHIHAARIFGTISRIGDVCDIYDDYFPLEQWESICDPVHLTKCPMEPYDPKKGIWQDYENKALEPFVKTLFKLRVYAGIMKKAVKMVKDFNNDFPDRGHTGTASTAAGHVPSHNVGGTPTYRPLRNMFEKFAPSMQRQSEDMFYQCHGWRFFVTDAGDLGLAPKASAVGDKVMNIAGVKEPCVVKLMGESDAGLQVVQLVGVCGAKLVQVGADQVTTAPGADEIEVLVR